MEGSGTTPWSEKSSRYAGPGLVPAILNPVRIFPATRLDVISKKCQSFVVNDEPPEVLEPSEYH